MAVEEKSHTCTRPTIVGLGILPLAGPKFFLLLILGLNVILDFIFTR